MRTTVPPALQARREQQLSWCDNDSTRDARRYVWSLDDEVALAIARTDPGKGSPEFERAIAHLGGSLWKGGRTNPVWLTHQAAEEAYVRGLIDEQELDWLTR